jgi:SagB-type dehydrogenase family enzyme
VKSQLRRFVTAGLLECTNEPGEPAPTVWDTWGEAAAFLHFATRDRQFEPVAKTRARVAARARAGAPPPPTKPYRGRPRLILPTVGDRSSFERLLRQRRTWRRFGRGWATKRDLAAVLGLTFRAQRWLDAGPFGRVMLRSAPSGGARHSTEAYVLVRRIKGVPPGVYYYAPAEHALVLLRAKRIATSELTALVGGQWWYGNASALICMSSVFERTAWVYRSPRVYKSLLLEAGHFCQTLCLAATARRLAPFCTAAFGASRIERLLQIDGVSESVMYVAGFGTRPRGVTWAPLPRGEENVVE